MDAPSKLDVAARAWRDACAKLASLRRDRAGIDAAVAKAESEARAAQDVVMTLAAEP